MEADCVQCPGKLFRNLEDWSCVERCPVNLHKIEMQNALATNERFRYCRGSNIFVDPTPRRSNV